MVGPVPIEARGRPYPYNITMKPFILDIETGPRPDAADYLPHIEAPSNYRDPAKIESYLAERRAKQLADAALSAETARILAVGVLRGEIPEVFAHDDESELLRVTWSLFERKEANQVFVTFNGGRFDWPMIARRSYALGVPVPSWFPRDGRWPKRTHVDLLELWQNGDRTETISLDRLARLCGLPGKTGNGAEFAQKWAADRQAALDYLRADLELTAAVYRRLCPATGANDTNDDRL